MKKNTVFGIILALLAKTAFSADQRCPLVSPQNTGSITIACAYPGEKNALPGIGADTADRNSIQQLFSKNHLNLCDQTYVTKKMILEKIRKFSLDKQFINYIIAGHAVPRPVFKAGKFLRMETSLILPGMTEACKKSVQSIRDFAQLEKDIKSQTKIRKRELDSFSKCDQHFLRLSELSHAESQTITGIMDTCYSGGAFCQNQKSSFFVMSSERHRTSPDSTYDASLDSTLDARLAKAGTSRKASLELQAFIERVSAEYKLKQLDGSAWSGDLLAENSFALSIFRPELEAKVVKDSKKETSIELLKQFDQHVKTAQELRKMIKNGIFDAPQQNSFTHHLLMRKPEQLDSNRDGKVTVREFYTVPSEFGEYREKPQSYIGPSCSDLWLDHALKELSPRTSQGEVQGEEKRQHSYEFSF